MRLFAVAAAVLATVGLCVASAAGAFGGSTYPRVVKGAAPPPTSAELRTLGLDALTEAEDFGDSHPTEAFAVPTTTHVASQVGAVVTPGPDRPAYFVLLHGHFPVYPNGPVHPPVGWRPPTAGILTFTTGTPTNNPRAAIQDADLIEDEAPDLYAMGEPEPLPLPLRAPPQPERPLIDSPPHGPTLAGQVQVVDYPGNDAVICPGFPGGAGFTASPQPPPCENGLTANDVDPTLLTNRARGTRWGLVYLVGYCRLGLFWVTSQRLHGPRTRPMRSSAFAGARCAKSTGG